MIYIPWLKFFFDLNFNTLVDKFFKQENLTTSQLFSDHKRHNVCHVIVISVVFDLLDGVTRPMHTIFC